MLRLVHLVILPGMLLTTCASWLHADLAAKQVYSNRPLGYTVPTPYYGTPMAPRFAVPPVVQYRVAANPNMVVVGQSPALAPLLTESSSPGQSAAPMVIENRITIEQPAKEINVNDELDTFNARLAKIQLEKHQLNEALKLIQNIKSETFKVQTLVSLAEYVSRDKNYQSEAESLYRLAISGIDALNRKVPFNMDVQSVVQPPQGGNQGGAVVMPQPPGGTPGGAGQETVTPKHVPEEVPDIDPPGPTGGDPPGGDDLIRLPLGSGGTNGNGGKGGIIPAPPPPDGKGIDGGSMVTTNLADNQSSQEGVEAPPAGTLNNGSIPPVPTTTPTVSSNGTTEPDRDENGELFVPPSPGINIGDDDPITEVKPQEPPPKQEEPIKRPRPGAIILPTEN